MAELDAELMVDQVTMIGLVSREQFREARTDAEDGSPDAVLRMLVRKGSLTSWQIDRLKKGDPSGFFYGDAKVLFHLAEGTFARVYRGRACTDQRPAAGGQGAAPAVRPAPRGGRSVPQGGRGRHAAPPPQHRPDHRRGPAGQSPLT